jgi:aerobic carbon-monoxide dehydrogenase medium subunit
MKPPPFAYLSPTGLDEALELLAARPGEARALAGGQSLVPAMNLRLATPAALVDLNRIAGHDALYVDGGDLVVDMLVRHRALENILPEDPLGHLLAEGARLVGHLPIRTRGTFAGSLAHADPAAEWCALALALDAVIVAHTPAGERSIPASDFFVGPYSTSLAPEELITSVRLPLLRRGGAAIVEQSRTAGDFATVVAVAVLVLEDGGITSARVCVGGAETRPVRAQGAESALVGASPRPEVFDAAAHEASEEIDPVSDAVSSAGYRRHLTRLLTRRALDLASARAAA